MKSYFLAGIVLGLLVGVGAARFYPWVDHPRAVSHTTVLQNGGRGEDFLIRFPVDRIVSAGTAGMGLLAKNFPADIEFPEEIADESVLVEHFKLRSVQGDVIGLASRHASVTEDEATTAWALTLPGRGTMRLLGEAEPGTLARGLAAAGRIEGEEWNGDIQLDMVSDETGSGRVAGGSHEFAGLAGTYAENWLISGVNQAGELRGTIELHTVVESSE